MVTKTETPGGGRAALRRIEPPGHAMMFGLEETFT